MNPANPGGRTLRADLRIIADWIPQGARVLDLGCGNGDLLATLQTEKQVTGYGLEIDPDKVVAGIAAGVNVLQLDLDAGLEEFEDRSFDVVVMASALQQVQRPVDLIGEMLRIGRRGIVTFPNFGHWRPRLSIAWQGVMPVSKALPDQWYDTPNIHLCTVRDFEKLCTNRSIDVTRRHVVNHRHASSWRTRVFPNLLGEIALYELERGQA